MKSADDAYSIFIDKSSLTLLSQTTLIEYKKLTSKAKGQYLSRQLSSYGRESDMVSSVVVMVCNTFFLFSFHNLLLCFDLMLLGK
jgi:hypothetical protein